MDRRHLAPASRRGVGAAALPHPRHHRRGDRIASLATSHTRRASPPSLGCHRVLRTHRGRSGCTEARVVGLGLSRHQSRRRPTRTRLHALELVRGAPCRRAHRGRLRPTTKARWTALDRGLVRCGRWQRHVRAILRGRAFLFALQVDQLPHAPRHRDGEPDDDLEPDHRPVPCATPFDRSAAKRQRIALVSWSWRSSRSKSSRIQIARAAMFQRGNAAPFTPIDVPAAASTK